MFISFILNVALTTVIARTVQHQCKIIYINDTLRVNRLLTLIQNSWNRIVQSNSKTEKQNKNKDLQKVLKGKFQLHIIFLQSSPSVASEAGKYCFFYSVPAGWS